MLRVKLYPVDCLDDWCVEGEAVSDRLSRMTGVLRVKLYPIDCLDDWCVEGEAVSDRLSG